MFLVRHIITLMYIRQLMSSNCIRYSPRTLHLARIPACLFVGACHSVDIENCNVWVGGALGLESTGYGPDGIEEFWRIGFLGLSMQEDWSDVETRRTIDLI